MKRTFQLAITCIVAAGVTATAQQSGTSSQGSAAAQSGQTITVQGCLQQGAGMTGGTAPGTAGSAASTAGTARSPGAAGSTGSTAATTPAQGATVQTGQAAGAAHAAAAAAAGMYTLRVTDQSGTSRTGMPSASAGQTDERAAAGQRGGRVYHLTADASTNLAAHVGHQVEVTGKLSASTHHDQSSARGGTATTAPGAAGAGSGSSGYTGQATSGSGATGAGAAGGTSTTGTPSPSSQAGTSTPGMGSMAEHGKAAGVIRVSNLKMIASTCR